MPHKKNIVCMHFSKKFKIILSLILVKWPLIGFCATNVVNAVASDPIAHSPANWNFIIPISAFFVGAVAAAWKYLGENGSIKEETLRNNAVTKDINKHIENVSSKIEEAIREQAKHKEIQSIANQDIKASISELQKELALIKQKSAHDDKDINELKQENKEMVKLVEKLISELVVFLNR